VVNRQVLLKDKHIIDFDLKGADGVLHNAVEVKGWTADTWRRALQAWEIHIAGRALEPRQKILVNQLERLIAQLMDASRAPRTQPFLVVTDKLSKNTLRDLRDLLFGKGVDVKIMELKELEIIETSRRLRIAFKLPETPPRKSNGGTQ
jgi:hypothetical protein